MKTTRQLEEERAAIQLRAFGPWHDGWMPYSPLKKDPGDTSEEERRFAWLHWLLTGEQQ